MKLDSDSKYPFAFDLVTGRHGFKKVRRVKLSDEERRALDKIEERLLRKRFGNAERKTPLQSVKS
jgi:hypothetical protein